MVAFIGCGQLDWDYFMFAPSPCNKATKQLVQADFLSIKCSVCVPDKIQDPYEKLEEKRSSSNI